MSTHRVFATIVLVAIAGIGATTPSSTHAAPQDLALDIAARMEVADWADRVIRPVAMSAGGFAGIYQEGSGRIVVRFTSLTNAERTTLAQAAGDRPMQILEGARSTFADLQRASDEIWMRRDELLGGTAVFVVSIDEIHNQLEVGVYQVPLDLASVADRVSGALGVDVTFVATQPAHNQQTCDPTGRSYCYNPMRAGTLINNGTYQGTMAYHAQLKTNTSQKAFVSAGHLVWGSSWDLYMVSYGFIGAVWTGKNLYGVDLGQDFMVVHMPSSQVSRQIYDTSRAVAGSGNPVTGESICVSPGQTDENNNSGNNCLGWVRNASISWVNDIGKIMRGADADGYTLIDGDSGSPIYREVGGGAVAIGLHNTVQGYFAKMQDGLNATGFSIY